MPIDLTELVDTSRGFISPRIFYDDAIYEEEAKQIFGRCWLFLAHDSMVPKSGDFIQTYMAEDPVLVVRQRDGSVKAFLNQCRHRGMRICRADQGNCKAFTCTYHGWTYDIAGKLINVPHEDDGYHNEIDKDSWGPIQVAKIQNYRGFWFATWDETAPDLVEYLGDFIWYFDSWCDIWEGGTEIVDTGYKWIIDCNWKFAAEQFASDMYHGEMSHASFLTVLGGPGRSGADDQSAPTFTMPTRQFSSLNGHGIGFFLSDESQIPLSTQGLLGGQAALIEEFWANSREGAVARLGELRGGKFLGDCHANIFPNFSFLGPTRTMRVWHPRGPNQIEVWAWVNVPAEASDEVKDAFRRLALRTFNPAGFAEQDDGENWNEIQKVLRGTVARSNPFNAQMGLGHASRDANGFPGTTNYGIGEEAARHMYQRWADLMSGATWAELSELNRQRVAQMA